MCIPLKCFLRARYRKISDGLWIASRRSCLETNVVSIPFDDPTKTTWKQTSASHKGPVEGRRLTKELEHYWSVLPANRGVIKKSQKSHLPKLTGAEGVQFQRTHKKECQKLCVDRPTTMWACNLAWMLHWPCWHPFPDVQKAFLHPFLTFLHWWGFLIFPINPIKYLLISRVWHPTVWSLCD